MDKKKFEAILPIITADLISKIAEKYGWSEDKSIEKLNESKLYSYIENEGTKVWQYSSDKLLILFNDEMNGKLELPEY